MAVSENPTLLAGSDPDSAGQFERRLAAALNGQASDGFESNDRPDAIAAMTDAALYHGVAGLLADRPDVLRDWPRPLVEKLTDQARAQAMWELRHRDVLGKLLAALEKAGIRTLLMKGTAVAYDLYANPAARSRGDTDLLVEADHLGRCQQVLARLGYQQGTGDGIAEEFANQQPRTLTAADGSTHSIDLHWHVMNAQSLRDILTVGECLDQSRPLPRLSPAARTMDRVRLLLHTCLHRAMHCNAPYFVAQATYFGSDRLIWTCDVHLLSEALDRDQWSLFCGLAEAKGVAGVCRDGLQTARATLGTRIPDDVLGSLEASSARDRKFPHLVPTRALARAWHDVQAVDGLSSKIRYARPYVWNLARPGRVVGGEIADYAEFPPVRTEARKPARTAPPPRRDRQRPTPPGRRR